MSQSLLFVFHKQPKFGRFSFFDSAKNLPYYNRDVELAAIVASIDECIKPWLSALQKKPKVSVSCAMSGLIMQLLLENKELGKQFTALVQAGQIEMLLSPYSSSFSSLLSKELFVKELSIQQELLQAVNPGPIPGFINSAALYSNDLATILTDFGLRYAVVPRLPWYLPKNSKASFYLASNKKLHLAAFSGSDAAQNTAEEFLLVDGFSNRATSYILDTKTALTAIGNVHDTTKVSETYGIANLVATNLQGTAKQEDYLGNSLQKDFLERLKQLSVKVAEAKNGTYLHDFLWLASSEHFFNLSNAEVPAKRYTNFVVLQNMVYDLDLKLR